MNRLGVENGDFNGDGAFTITDIWYGVGALFHVPGDFAVAALVTDSKAAKFLELDCTSLGGFWSTSISAVVWLAALYCIVKVNNWRTEREYRFIEDRFARAKPNYVPKTLSYHLGRAIAKLVRFGARN